MAAAIGRGAIASMLAIFWSKLMEALWSNWARPNSSLPQ